jgi:hypothetical protein
MDGGSRGPLTSVARKIPARQPGVYLGTISALRDV